MLRGGIFLKYFTLDNFCLKQKIEIKILKIKAKLQFTNTIWFVTVATTSRNKIKLCFHGARKTEFKYRCLIN